MEKALSIISLLFLLFSCGNRKEDFKEEIEDKITKEFHESLHGKWTYSDEIVTDIDSVYLSPIGLQYIEEIKKERTLSIGCSKAKGDLQITFGEGNKFTSSCNGNQVTYHYEVDNNRLTLLKSDYMIMYDYKILDDGRLEITGDDQEFTRKVYFKKL